MVSKFGLVILAVRDKDETCQEKPWVDFQKNKRWATQISTKYLTTKFLRTQKKMSGCANISPLATIKMGEPSA